MHDFSYCIFYGYYKDTGNVVSCAPMFNDTTITCLPVDEFHPVTDGYFWVAEEGFVPDWNLFHTMFWLSTDPRRKATSGKKNDKKTDNEEFIHLFIYLIALNHMFSKSL